MHQRWPFIFKRSGCKGDTIYWQHTICTTENVPLIKDDKISLHNIWKGYFSINHRLQTAAYISILRSAQLFPKVKWIYRTANFWVKNTKKAAEQTFLNLCQLPWKSPLFPCGNPCLLAWENRVSPKHFQKRNTRMLTCIGRDRGDL